MSQPAAQRQLQDLDDTGATIIRSDHEHRKIVVVDDEVVLLGSLNVLSNKPGSSRETMVTMEGQQFARRLLGELRVDDIGTPKACPSCRRTMDVRRRGRRAELSWQCGSCKRRVPVEPSSASSAGW